MRAIVTLFDFYADEPNAYSPVEDEYGIKQEYKNCYEHIDQVINALGNNNATVLAWDIKNEVDRDYDKAECPTCEAANVKAWVREMLRYIKEDKNSTNLRTVGFKGSLDDIIFDESIPAEFVADVDVVSMHYFLPENNFEADLQDLINEVAKVSEKPIVLEEFGLHTSYLLWTR